MGVRLQVRQKSEAGGKANDVVLDLPEILLGRDKSCQVVLPLQAVSRNHARITQDGSLYFVEDLGSAYGTTVNGKALPKGEKRLLRNGDLIAIAQFDVTFERIAEQRVDDGKTSLVARSIVKDVMRGLDSEGPYFRVMNGPREGEKIPISDAAELIIGREEGVEIVLKDDLISRKHAKVRRDWSGTHVEDLESRNGIRVNKKRVNRKTLKDRDELEVGGIRLLYLDPTEVREAPVVLRGDQRPDDHEGEPTNSGLVKEVEDKVKQKEEEAAAAAAALSAGPASEASVPSGEVPAEPQSEVSVSSDPNAGLFSDGQGMPMAPLENVDGPPTAATMALPGDPSARQKIIFLALMGVVGLGALGLILAILLGA
jgi:pSer/pThr/pTyr-binding forkhead associated (FHA) protein